MAEYEENTGIEAGQDEFTKDSSLTEETAESVSGGYLDDFDDLRDELESEDEQEVFEEKGRKSRFSFLSGFSNLSATIIGAVIILGLVYLIVSMINFLINGFSQFFTNL